MQTYMEVERRAEENDLLIFLGLGRERELAISCPALGKRLQMFAFFPALFLEDEEGKRTLHFYIKMYFSRCNVVG